MFLSLPDPDPLVRGRYGSGSFYHQAKIIRKTLIPTPCCGSGMFILDQTFFHPGSFFSHPGSRIHIKEFKYFNPKKCFLSSQKYDPGCSSKIRIPDFYPSQIQKGTGFLPIPGSKRHRIRIRNTVPTGTVLRLLDDFLTLNDVNVL
jgi:hypothetical protein